MNVRDLHEKLRERFTCINGTPRNYMEILVPGCECGKQGPWHFARFIYQVIGVTMRGEPEDVESILCAWMWQRLMGSFPEEVIEDRSTLILFRRWPEVSNYIDNEHFQATKLTMRLVIPGQDLKHIFGDAVKADGEMLFRL